MRPWLKRLVIPFLLLIPLVVSLAIAPQRLPRFILGFGYTGPLVDVDGWQRWVTKNHEFFGPLGETARFAIVSHRDDSTGLIFTREREGVVVRKSHFILFRNVPLIFVMSPQSAIEMRSLDLDDGDQFWDGIKYLVQSRKVKPYAYVPRRELDRVGLVGFLQIIDAIPPD